MATLSTATHSIASIRTPQILLFILHSTVPKTPNINAATKGYRRVYLARLEYHYPWGLADPCFTRNDKSTLGQKIEVRMRDSMMFSKT